MTGFDALVAGGGPAGSALAIELARAGGSVILFEREKSAHDKVCGEFISHEGVAYLEKLGLPPLSLGSRPIEHIRLARRGSPVTTRLPFAAQSLSRRLLDEALLDCAAASGARVRRGARVTRLMRRPGGWAAEIAGASPVFARDAFLATGKHDLRDWRRPLRHKDDLIGFKSHWRLAEPQAKALEGHVELLLFPGGYAGLQGIEDGRANLCLLIRRGIFSGLGHDHRGLLEHMMSACRHLRHRLSGASMAGARPLAVAGLPYGYVARGGGDGPWRLGDQAAVIPSFAGEGISLALHGAFLAVRYYLSGAGAANFQERFARDVSAQVKRAAMAAKALTGDPGQAVAIALARAAPGFPALLAALTRIPHRAFDGGAA